MALPTNHAFTETIVQCYAHDISTAGSSFARAPFRGKVIKLISVIKNAITVADNTVAVTYRYVNGCTKSATAVSDGNHLAWRFQIQALPSPSSAPRGAARKLRR